MGINITRKSPRNTDQSREVKQINANLPQQQGGDTAVGQVRGRHRHGQRRRTLFGSSGQRKCRTHSTGSTVGAFRSRALPGLAGRHRPAKAWSKDARCNAEQMRARGCGEKRRDPASGNNFNGNRARWTTDLLHCEPTIVARVPVSASAQGCVITQAGAVARALHDGLAIEGHQ